MATLMQEASGLLGRLAATKTGKRMLGELAAEEQREREQSRAAAIAELAVLTAAREAAVPKERAELEAARSKAATAREALLAAEREAAAISARQRTAGHLFDRARDG